MNTPLCGLCRAVEADRADPFGPPGDDLPLTNVELEAAAVRAQYEFGHAVDPRDITDSVLRAFSAAIASVRARGEQASADAVLRAVEGIAPREAVESWCLFDIGGPWRVGDPEAALQVRRLAWWRRMREACLMAAIACEKQDARAAFDALSNTVVQLQRALNRIARRAA